MAFPEMYYRRVISIELQRLLMCGGELHWLYKLVKERKDLDFLIAANNSKQHVFVYRGTTRLLDIALVGGLVRISAHQKYTDLAHKNNLDIYRDRDLSDLDFEYGFIQLISYIPKDTHYDNKKEGYFQNLFSRQFGILSEGTEDFVVIDKEVVIGYQNMQIKEKYFGDHQKTFKNIYGCLSKHLHNVGSKLSEKDPGNEIDFLAVDKRGKVLLIEFKHSSNPAGIYLSPIQIGLYCHIFCDYISRFPQAFKKDISDMLEQKKEMGLISKNFPKVNLSDKIVPVLIIAEYNKKSSALNTFKAVLKVCRDKFEGNTFLSELEVYGYNEDKKLEQLPY